ncbi:MAG: thioredoxin domain-containing protein, partial [Spirochaetia bacterium]|nr:thioredoxin domain-containing protein [Spirochaetia bacterium]
MKSIISTVIVLTFSVIVSTGCQTDDTPYLVVDGKKITVNDLKENSPEQYEQIKKDYDNRVVSSLKDLAVQKMVEIESKEKGKTPEQYMQDFYTQIPAPSPEEINQVYLSLKNSGRVPDTDREILNQQIIEYLKREKASEVIQEEISKLKKKYNYKVVYKTEIKRVDVKIDGDPFRGNPDGKIVIVEFSDYECPFCQKAQKVSMQIREKYGDKVKWVFKDFPLDF